jgi:hypothetical protein
VLEIDEGVAGPDGLPKIFAANHHAGSFYQSPQNLKRLLLNPDSDAVLAELSPLGIEVERPELVAAHFQSIMTYCER